MTLVYLGLGSNLDVPGQQIDAAVAALKQLPDTAWRALSPLYRSAPVGPPGQPEYLNAVAAVDTQLAPHDLLDALQAIERDRGRRRDGPRWGARTLDIDILLYGQQQIDTTRLQVPHPEIPRRGFVLQPLYDLAPDLVVPGMGSVAELLAAVSTADLVLLSPGCDHDG